MKANELSCKDLMVGDWVRIKITQHNTKVTNIDANSVYTEAAFPIRYDEIEPISLTPDILEKNGIKWLSTEPSGRRTYCCNKPVIHCTYFPNSGWLVCVGACGSNKVRFVEISKVQHVHQLQHALRLYGIDDKEIIL